MRLETYFFLALAILSFPPCGEGMSGTQEKFHMVWKNLQSTLNTANIPAPYDIDPADLNEEAAFVLLEVIDDFNTRLKKKVRTTFENL